MKYTYTLFIALFVLVVTAQAQITIDIQPKCTVANQQVELTVRKVSGKDFNGSTTITVNNQTVSITHANGDVKAIVPASLIRTAGNVQVVASTANETSQPVVLSVVGPLSVSSTPSCGGATLRVQGGPANASYRWYNPSGQLISRATSSSLSVTQVGQYKVSVVTASGCEMSIGSVTASFPANQFANTEFARQEVSVGKPAVLQLYSDVFDRGHGASVRWEAYNFVTGARNVLAVTEAPKAGPASFQVPSIEANTYYEASITVLNGVCYDDYMLSATTQGILALPVELTSFKGQRNSQSINLTWATASELDNKGFEVQTSADGRNFKTIAFVESKVGTTSLAQNYSFAHKNPASGANYYRLKQVDFDGAFEFSKTIAVQYTPASASSVYPTLATDQIKVKLLSTDEQVTVTLSDMNGRQLVQVQNPGERELVLPVSNLQQGMYFVSILSGSQKETFRVMKQ